jgi:hypothetical protein
MGQKLYIKDFYNLPNLYVEGTYIPWSDDAESSFGIVRVTLETRFSMGVGHDDDITRMFIDHPLLGEQLSTVAIKLIEKE